MNSNGIDFETAIRLQNCGITKLAATRLRLERYQVPRSRQAKTGVHHLGNPEERSRSPIQGPRSGAATAKKDGRTRQ